MKTPGTNPIPLLFASALKPALFAVALALLLAEPTPQASEANLNPGIIPPHANPYGQSYGEWSARWWQWVYTLPVTGHPLFDTTGADAAVGQSGPVWFLGGTFLAFTDQSGRSLGVATRAITVPTGKALFFPILNIEVNNFNWPPPPTTLTEAELRAYAQQSQNMAANLTCTIDGVPVRGLEDAIHTRYRVQSPLFDYLLPVQDNLFQFWGYDFSGPNPPPGDVADGVHLMLTPLPPGQHTIHFGGDFVTPEGIPFFTLDITYNITVDPHARDAK